MINNRNLQSKSNSILDYMPEDILVKTILFYLDINSLPIFSTVNKRSNQCVKIHMFIRLYFLNKEKQSIVEENKQIIEQIKTKRNNFLINMEIPLPSLTRAQTLINKLSRQDLKSLKVYFKKYIKKYESLIVPFVILLGKSPKVTYGANGNRNVSYYSTMVEILNDKNLIPKLSSYQLETIEPELYITVDKIIQGKEFNEENLKKFSKPIRNLIDWVKGALEFHRILRKFCLNEIEQSVLTQDEIGFSSEMDTVDLLYYKLKRYTTNYCKIYEEKAKNYMLEMNIIVEEKNENE